MNSRRPLQLAVALCGAAAAAVFLVAVRYATVDVPVLILGSLLLVGALLRSKVGPVRASLDYVVCVALFLLSGVASAVVVSVILPLSQDRRLPRIRRIFNGAQAILCATAAGVVFQAAGGGWHGLDVVDHPLTALVATTLAISTWLAVSALLICLVLWLDRGGTSPVEFLRTVAAPTAVPMMGYGLLGLLLAVVWLTGLGPVAALLVAVPLFVARWALSQYEAEREAQAATMRAFIQVIEAKDPYTRGHSERVSYGVGLLGRHLGIPEDRQHALEHAGLLHDCGKVGVPTSVIQKAGTLDAAEWDAVRLHPARGVELIGDIPFLEEVKSAVLHHHEKFDGSGYPAGLSGRNIPYFARMIGIVDAFDCLTSTRAYRSARGVEETLQILIQDKGSHFDPDLVDAFVAVVRRRGWVATAQEQPAPDASLAVAIDHDDLSLGSGGGATGSAVEPG